MNDLLMALVQIFAVELFTARALNSGIVDNRFTRLLWRSEKVAWVGALGGLVTGQVGVVQGALIASVSIYLLRLVIFCIGFGLTGLLKILDSGLGTLAQVLGGVFFSLIDAITDESKETFETESSDHPDGPASFGNHKYITGFGAHTSVFEIHGGMNNIHLYHLDSKELSLKSS